MAETERNKDNNRTRLIKERVRVRMLAPWNVQEGP